MRSCSDWTCRTFEIETPSCSDDRADEVRERLDLGPRDHVAQRVPTGLADAHLGEGSPELVDEGPLHLLDDLAQGGIEAKPGADGDREQVEGVGDADDDLLLAALDATAEPELRPDVADPRADQREQGAHQQVVTQDPDHEEEQRRADAGADRFDAEPVADPHVAGIAGHREALLGPFAE